MNRYLKVTEFGKFKGYVNADGNIQANPVNLADSEIKLFVRALTKKYANYMYSVIKD